MNSVRIIQSVALAAALAVGAIVAPAVAATSGGTAHLHGRIVTVAGDVLSLRLRDGRVEKVDISAARAAHHTGALAVGEAVLVYGARDTSGLFHVVSVGHVSQNAKEWTSDD